MPVIPPNRIRFGVFQLDLMAGELRRGGNRVVLQEQPFQLLRMLVERNGEIVTREEIEAELWSNDVVVEFDTGINQAIKRLRKALGDSADAPKYVETVGRRGYRLIVPVERVEVASQKKKEDPTNWHGKRISHYRVLEIIGGGGMGVVYKAEDLMLGRQVALKFLPEELSSNPTALDRFRLEARTASSLNHPNICTIHEFGEHEGHLFIAMELLEGQTLRNCLASGLFGGIGPATEMARERLLDIALQILDGLHAAHEQGIIHRDIKPVNLFVTNLGVTKILDFGLATLVESTGRDAVAEEQAQTVAATSCASIPSSVFNLSRFGIPAGTAGYMSPEQIRGEKLDPRTDLFSFGLVLYEMATGRRAFGGETVEELHDAILNQVTPPVQVLKPELLPILSQVINKALQKDREQRYGNAAELLADIIQLKRSLQSGTGQPQEVGRNSPIRETAAAVEQQTRFLEAAAPKEAMVDRSIEVVTMVRREGSGGLRAYLKIEGPLGPSPEDVQERLFEFVFAVDGHGVTQPADITLRLESPNFEPRSQTKQLRVPPGADSAPCTFLITPQVAGGLIAHLELLSPGQQVLVSRSIRIAARAKPPMTDLDVVVLTIPLKMLVHADYRTKTGSNTLGLPGPETVLAGPLAIGKEVSHYRLLELIGGGGMGVVCKAKDLLLGRIVALKFISSQYGSHSEAFQRFEREACISSALKHPNICAVYDVGESDGHPFIVMEFLEGQTLRGCLASGILRAAVPASQVAISKLLDIAIQIGDGLGVAHENGIIHRDIKPDNIFITNQGIAKILDFGLAQAAGSVGNHPFPKHPDLTATLLQDGDSLWASNFSTIRAGVLGTLAYMSPEQVCGEKLDARTDLFSLGLVLYEMATGRRAFKGGTAEDLIESITNQTPVPSVSYLNPKIPRELERIISRAVQKPRELRYESAAQMRADLEAALAGPIS